MKSRWDVLPREIYARGITFLPKNRQFAIISYNTGPVLRGEGHLAEMKFG